MENYTDYFHMRCGVFVSLEKEGEILLALRQNTGYNDGLYGLVGGHLEAGETFVQAVLREAKEEVGIEIDPVDLQQTHVMHRLDNIQTVNVFFRCTRWAKEIQNCEPEKCAGLTFFPKEALPETLTSFIRDGIHLSEKGIPFSERGFSGVSP